MIQNYVELWGGQVANEYRVSKYIEANSPEQALQRAKIDSHVYREEVVLVREGEKLESLPLEVLNRARQVVEDVLEVS